MSFTGEDKCYFAFVLPAPQKIVQAVEKKIDGQLKFVTPLAQAVVKGLRKRFGHLLDQDLDHEDSKMARDVREAILATVSHPKFKRLPIKDQERAKEMLIEEASRLAPDVESPSPAEKKANDDFFHYRSITVLFCLFKLQQHC